MTTMAGARADQAPDVRHQGSQDRTPTNPYTTSVDVGTLILAAGRVGDGDHWVSGFGLMVRLRAVPPPGVPSTLGWGIFTFLFTDIEGSTALLRRLGDGVYAQVLAGHHALIRSALAAHDGREVDTQGDGFFAVFSSPRACVAAVLQMQQALQSHDWPAGEQVRVRMGIHSGEAARTAAGLVGLEVQPGRPGGGGRSRRPGAGVGAGGCAGARLAAAGRSADRSGQPSAEGPGPPGTDLPAPRGGPASRVPAAPLSGQPGAAEQSPGSAVDVHRPGPRDVRDPGLGRVLSSGDPDRGRRGARPGWVCRWQPSCSMGPEMGSGWRSWPRSRTTRWPRPFPKRCGLPGSRADPPWRLCWMPSPPRMSSLCWTTAST